jgi:hypothetical protein
VIARSTNIVLLISVAFALTGCEEEIETTWVQFNADNDSVEVEVGSATIGDAVTGTLHSTSGAIEIGSFSVNPGSAPVGTDHLVEVVVDNDWEEQVDRATLLADSGARGSDEYELRQDSADHGHWWVEVTSSGDPAEIRTDVFTVFLYEEETVDTTIWTAYSTSESE